VQDEGYPPPAEMPIKKLEFTPFKPPPAAKISDASSKDSVEDAEGAELEGASANAEVIIVSTCCRVFHSGWFRDDINLPGTTKSAIGYVC
jgi:hypothetical protein